MLLGKDLGGSHYAGLETVPYGNQGGQHGHHRFPASDISLKEPVHLPAASEVLADFLYHPFLCSRQVEGQRTVAFPETIPDFRHRDSH